RWQYVPTPSEISAGLGVERLLVPVSSRFGYTFIESILPYRRRNHACTDLLAGYGAAGGIYQSLVLNGNHGAGAK
ncbi:MAG: hypothetical protein ABIZ09_14640, partial [Rhodoferax sp.]